MLKITKILAILVATTFVLASCGKKSTTADKDTANATATTATALAKSGGYVIKGLFAKREGACSIVGQNFDVATKKFITVDAQSADTTAEGKLVFKHGLPQGSYYDVTCSGQYIDENTAALAAPIVLHGFFSINGGIHNINVFTDILADSNKQDIKDHPTKTFEDINKNNSKALAKLFHVDTSKEEITDVSLLNSADPSSAGDIALLTANLNVLQSQGKSMEELTGETVFALKNKPVIKNGKVVGKTGASYTAPLSGVNLARVAKVMKNKKIATDGIGGIAELAYNDISDTVGLQDDKGKALTFKMNNGMLVLPNDTKSVVLPTKASDPKNSVYYTLDDGANWVELDEETRSIPIASLQKATTIIMVEGAKSMQSILQIKYNTNVLTSLPPKDANFILTGYFNVRIAGVDVKVKNKNFGTEPQIETGIQIGAVTKSIYPDISATVGLQDQAGKALTFKTKNGRVVSSNDTNNTRKKRRQRNYKMDNGMIVLPHNTETVVLPTEASDPQNSVYYTLDDGTNWVELDEETRSIPIDSLQKATTVIMVEGTKGKLAELADYKGSVLTTALPTTDAKFTPKGYFKVMITGADAPSESNPVTPPFNSKARAKSIYNDISATAGLQDLNGNPLQFTMNNDILVLPHNTRYVVLSTKASDAKNSIYYTLDDGKSWVELDFPTRLLSVRALQNATTVIMVEGAKFKQADLATYKGNVLTTALPKTDANFIAKGYFKVMIAGAEVASQPQQQAWQSTQAQPTQQPQAWQQTQAQRDQAARDQAAQQARDQAARDQAAQQARDQAAQRARDQAAQQARDQAARDQAAQQAREQAARDQAAQQAQYQPTQTGSVGSYSGGGSSNSINPYRGVNKTAGCVGRRDALGMQTLHLIHHPHIGMPDTTLKLLIVYTPKAAREPYLQEKLCKSAQFMQTAMDNLQVGVKFVVITAALTQADVHSISFPGVPQFDDATMTPDITTFNNLLNYLPISRNIKAKWDAVNPSMMTLLISIEPPKSGLMVAGIGKLNGIFSVVDANTLVQKYNTPDEHVAASLAHEVGHNFGLEHDDDNPSFSRNRAIEQSKLPFGGIGHGYVGTTGTFVSRSEIPHFGFTKHERDIIKSHGIFRTIMSYDRNHYCTAGMGQFTCPTIPYYSTNSAVSGIYYYDPINNKRFSLGDAMHDARSVILKTKNSFSH